MVGVPGPSRGLRLSVSVDADGQRLTVYNDLIQRLVAGGREVDVGFAGC